LTSYNFSSEDGSQPPAYDEAALLALQKAYLTQPTGYAYAELFDYNEAISGIKSGLFVEHHALCALDENGNLTKEHLLEIVKENNKQFLIEKFEDNFCNYKFTETR